MAATALTIGTAAGINYTYITDSSADWAAVPNSTYFYDKTDKLPHYKDSTGTVLEAFSAGSTGTVTSVGLTTGTSGTDVNVSGSPVTSSGSITLNIPTSSASNRGVLSSTDWSTFNSKQGAITLTTTGTSGASTLVGNTLNIPNYSFTSTNIYNSDGTLSGNRVVTMGGNTINFSGGNFGINTASFNGTNPERLLVAPSNQINAIVAKGSVNNFMQLNIQNNSNGSNSSSDVVATSNNGTDLINYIDMGINGSNYGGGPGLIGVANDAYLYSTGRELYIGNQNITTTGNIKFFAGNTGGSIGMTLNYQNRLGINTTTPAEILDVNGKAKVSQFQVTTGAASRYVLTSDASGNATWDFPPVSASEIHRGFYFSNNSTTVITEGGLTQGTTATVTAQSVASTSFATKQIRLRYAPTVVATGQYCGTRGSALLWFIGGGFRFICDFNVSDTAYGSTCQQFYGLAGQTTDLAYGGAGTTAVSALTNIIGLGSDAADTNLQIMHNDAAGTATKVDLGASFPANRTAGAAMTTVYSVMLYSAPAGTTVSYQVINQETGAIATGTLNTNLPLATQGLNIFASRAMGSPTTNTGQFDLSRLGCYSLM